MRPCPYCGHEVLKSERYCPNCGRIRKAPISLDKYSLGMIENYEIIKTLIGDISSYQPNQEAVNVYQNYLPLFQQVEGLLTPAYSTIAKLQQQSIH